MFHGCEFSCATRSFEHNITSLKMETEGGPQEQQHKEQKIAPGSRRYDLRTSSKDEIGQNVCQKWKAGYSSPTPVKKRLKAGDPCDSPQELRWADPCDQGPRSGVSSEVGIAERDPRSLVGRRIEVYWPLEEVWYSGKILRYDGYNKLHLVEYEDGEEEWVSLQRDKIRLLEERNYKKETTEETKSKHDVVEKSGGSRKAVQGTSVIAYRRKRKSANISKQDDFDKENYGIELGKHDGTNDSIQVSVIGGDGDSEQKDSGGSLKKGTRRYKRIKKDLKKVEISGSDDLQKDDVAVGVVSDQVENAGVSDPRQKGGVDEKRTTEGISEGVVIQICTEQGSFGSPEEELKSKPVTRFTYQRRRQGTSNPLSSGRARIGNTDAVMHQRHVDVDSKALNAYEGTELLQPIQWLEELFIVEDVLNIHISPLSLRRPSYWQCVAHAMQLCKRGNMEIVKSQSLKDLMLVLRSILHFYSASDKKSTSYHFMEHFRARSRNSMESGTIMEYFKPMTTMSDIDVKVCLVGSMSSVRQLQFRRSFQEIFSNVPEYNDLGFMSEAQLLSDSRGASAADDGTLALVPLEGLVNYANDADIINVSQQSTKNICFSSPLGFLDYSESVCEGSHNIQSLQMSYASSPSLFTNLHQRLLLVRNSYNQLSLRPLPKRLPRSTTSRSPRTKREYRRILVRSECNDPLLGRSWSVKAYSPLVYSSKNDCKDNRHDAFPVLKFQKISTDFGKWCCELNSSSDHGHTTYGGTRNRIQKLKNPIRFCRVDAPNGLLGNTNTVPFRSTRSARPGRPTTQCRQEKRSEQLNGPVMDFSKPGSELDSLSCTANILIVRVDRGWREADAEVTLKSLYTNEWTLDIKLHGFTRFTYKPQETKICKTQEERISRIPGQVHNRSKSHRTIWKTGGDWSLEFPNRHQWFLFKKLYKECYERNNGSFSVKHKDIPLPGVYLIENDSNLKNGIGPFARPLHYIKAEDEVSRAISSTHVLYDMDSDDERWLCQFNSNASDKISDETFERIINELEKLVFVTQPHLTINGAVEILSDLIPVEMLRSIFSYWEEKRNKKSTALFRQFQLGISKQTLSQNSSVESSKGKQMPAKGKQRPVIGPPSKRARNQRIGLTGFKITLKNQGIGIQNGQQQQKANVLPFGNESSSHSLGPISYIDAGLQKDTKEIDAYLKSTREICAVTQKGIHKAALQKERHTKMEIDTSNIDARVEALREICTVKRRTVQTLTQNFDLKAYIAGKAVRNAEVKNASSLPFGGSAIALELSTDGRTHANTSTRECSMGSSYWALAANGH